MNFLTWVWGDRRYLWTMGYFIVITSAVAAIPEAPLAMTTVVLIALILMTAHYRRWLRGRGRVALISRSDADES